MTTCLEVKFGAIVGQDIIDRTMCQLKHNVNPMMYPGVMVEGHNVKTIKELIKTEEVKKADTWCGPSTK